MVRATVQLLGSFGILKRKSVVRIRGQRGQLMSGLLMTANDPKLSSKNPDGYRQQQVALSLSGSLSSCRQLASDRQVLKEAARLRISSK